MVLKFLYQLDIFCISGYDDPNDEASNVSFFYNIQLSYYCDNLNVGTIRPDQILGIFKSASENDAVSVLLGDIVCLIFVSVHIMMLKKKGVWFESESVYDDYVTIWFKEYGKRQRMCRELERLMKEEEAGFGTESPRHRNDRSDGKDENREKSTRSPSKGSPSKGSPSKEATQSTESDDGIEMVSRIGEPQRIYDSVRKELVDKDDEEEYEDIVIERNKSTFVGLGSWDWFIMKTHSVVFKYFPVEVRQWLFSVIPPSFRLFEPWEAICDAVKPGIDLYFWMVCDSVPCYILMIKIFLHHFRVKSF